MNGFPLTISEFERRIGYVFKDKKLIETAFTHSSYSNELKVRHIKSECNERLEFLGDSVLSIIVSEYLFENYAEEHAEGDMTRMRADVVCEKALAKYATKIGLGDFLLLGNGEEKNHGRERKSITADAFEATLAAIYLDAGNDGKEIVSKFLLPFIKEVDYHTRYYTGSTQLDRCFSLFHLGGTVVLYADGRAVYLKESAIPCNPYDGTQYDGPVFNPHYPQGY